MYYYDIIGTRKLNKKKVAVVIVIVILTVVLSTILGIKFSEYQKERKQAIELQKEQEKIMQDELAKKMQEEEKRQSIIKERYRKVNKQLSEEEKDRILHIYRSTGEKRVFLTFDDGPSNSVTPLILDLLKQENIKATFFTLGNNVRNNPHIIKREFDEGHYVANHGYTHKYSAIYSSPEATLNEYKETENRIKESLQNPEYNSKVFRFPGGSNGGYYNEIKQNSKALLKENGVVHLDWNSLSEDAAGAQTKEKLLENIKNTMGEKDSVVILMHDTGDKILTYEMLKDLIPYLREKGYQFKNIYDLLD